MRLEHLELRRLFASPIVITEGGTYSGTWESDDPLVPAVWVQTDQPVVIENSILRGRGDLIFSQFHHANITVRNTSAYGLNPNVAGRAPGRFVNLDFADNVRLENNYLENTRGIRMLEYHGDFTSAETVKIIGNYAKNIDGRKSDGNGGWLDFNTRTNITDGTVENGFVYAQFIQLDKVRGVPGIEIAHNQVINEVGNSRVEDNINIYKSSGTSASPIWIHDNYIQGAYTIKPWLGGTETVNGWTYDWSFSGGGILLGDGGEKTLNGTPSWVKATNNVVIDTTNHGIAIAGGHDIIMQSNRVISAGVLADGRPIPEQNAGLYIWDVNATTSTYFFNNTAKDNVVGWVNPDLISERNDWWFPNATNPTGNQMIPLAELTYSRQQDELAGWLETHNPAGPRGTLAGTIFRDGNADGIRDTNDNAGTGFELYLDLDGDGLHDTGEAVARASSTGRYTFSDLLPGTYTVRTMSTTGWRPSKGGAAKLDVKGGHVATRYFGMTTLPLVTGTVYLDSNLDGGRSGGESGLSGWIVYADLNRNGILDDTDLSAQTNKLGKYALTVPAAGGYRIRIVQKPGFAITAPGAGYRAVDILTGQIVEGRNFGETRMI